MLRKIFSKQWRRKRAPESGLANEPFDNTFDTFVPARSEGTPDPNDGAVHAEQRDDVDTWMDMLPAAMRPYKLLSQHEDIVKRIVLLWNGDEAALLHYLEGLLVDKRGGRKGFPVDVAAELLRLNRLAHERFPSRSEWSKTENGYPARDWFAGRSQKRLKA